MHEKYALSSVTISSSLLNEIQTSTIYLFTKRLNKLFLLNVYITVNAKIHFDGRLTGLSKKETVDFDSENDYDKAIYQALYYTCGF